jgi:hypothetical protein
VSPPALRDGRVTVVDRARPDQIIGRSRRRGPREGRLDAREFRIVELEDRGGGESISLTETIDQRLPWPTSGDRHRVRTVDLETHRRVKQRRESQ